MNPLFEVENLGVSFGPAESSVQAVRGISWSLERGECLGVVGESGSGKSVSALAGLGLLDRQARVSGRVRLEGQNLDELTAEQRRRFLGPRLAMIFQEPSRAFDPISSLEAAFVETFRAHRPRMERAECRERAIRLLKEVQITDPEVRLKNYPHQFSGGMLQRVGIALALANDPEVLFCDEPTTALDVTIQMQIVDLLQNLKRTRHLALVFISHNLELVAGLADRILVMYAGLILESGPVRTVLEAPRSPYTQALLRSRLFWGQRWTTHPLSLIPGNPPDPSRPEPGCPFAPRCSRVQPVCSQKVPPLVARGDHQFRCFNLEVPL
jgi:oligopeptide/dipeptide ABC transporter ATP-binding protein